MRGKEKIRGIIVSREHKWKISFHVTLNQSPTLNFFCHSEHAYGKICYFKISQLEAEEDFRRRKNNNCPKLFLSTRKKTATYRYFINIYLLIIFFSVQSPARIYREEKLCVEKLFVNSTSQEEW
jgi:hypothetical protein